jgi:hypothetical protein
MFLETWAYPAPRAFPMQVGISQQLKDQLEAVCKQVFNGPGWRPPATHGVMALGKWWGFEPPEATPWQRRGNGSVDNAISSNAHRIVLREGISAVRYASRPINGRHSVGSL